MNPETGDLVKYRLSRAEEALDEAEVLYKSGCNCTLPTATGFRSSCLHTPIVGRMAGVEVLKTESAF